MAAGRQGMTHGEPCHRLTCGPASADAMGWSGFNSVRLADRAPPTAGRVAPGGVALLAALLCWTLLAKPELALGQSAPATAGPSGGQQPSRHVLLLYSEPRLTPALVSRDIRYALEHGLATPPQQG